MQRFQLWESVVSSSRELCRRGSVAGLLSLVLFPKSKCLIHLGSVLASL